MSINSEQQGKKRVETRVKRLLFVFNKTNYLIKLEGEWVSLKREI